MRIIPSRGLEFKKQLDEIDETSGEGKLLMTFADKTLAEANASICIHQMSISFPLTQA